MQRKKEVFVTLKNCIIFIAGSKGYRHNNDRSCITERENKSSNSQITESSDWIPEGFWQNKTAAQFETVDLNRDEQQLKG